MSNEWAFYLGFVFGVGFEGVVVWATLAYIDRRNRRR
jgi:hypothetical protein